MPLVFIEERMGWYSKKHPYCGQRLNRGVFSGNPKQG
jgi:hypothetical protein